MFSSVNLGIKGQDEDVNDFEGQWEDPEVVRNGLMANENATAIWQIHGQPDAPWRRIDYAYLYDLSDRSFMINLRCSLDGQGAPLSFASAGSN